MPAVKKKREFKRVMKGFTDPVSGLSKAIHMAPKLTKEQKKRRQKELTAINFALGTGLLFGELRR